LRERLNEELRKNNELLLRMSRLEQENTQMKREFQMSFGPSSEVQQLRSENERLRMNLSQASQIPQQIFS
jgi:cell shape-determining protein MreC